MFGFINKKLRKAERELIKALKERVDFLERANDYKVKEITRLKLEIRQLLAQQQALGQFGGRQDYQNDLQIEALRRENAVLRQENTSLKIYEANKSGFKKDFLKKLIALTHPDKHGGKKLAEEVTQELLSMRNS
jgi:chorismate mutase